ncbi:MAG: NERD domain-containing protein [Nitrospinae bacterium]|nr:NERD domain-containing protein [Nitrospinota bacterium]MBL7021205.1 NERD domain-containing protein [Nitrospinaceae bacterium]
MLDFFFTTDGLKVLALLAVVVVVVLIRRSRQHQLAADPKVVKDQLEQLGADYTVLSDVVVSAELGMNDVSHVVVSPYGVFVLTVKTEAGKVTGREGDREWHIKPAKDILYNPLWENRKHVNALEKIIGPVWFIPVVVFTRAVLKGDFGTDVVPLRGLIPYIKQHKKSRLSDDKRDEIARKLRSVSSY